MISFFISVFGLCEWFKDDKWHNNNGWAVQTNIGKKSYFVNGKLHCLEGPAHEYSNGMKRWFINGVEYTSEFEYWIAVNCISNST